ncbi:MAG: hypothetical protein VYA84_08955 [Planctomycetota bacterium]|nr:hypothetical protein [Planctomycetota bacterium]
MAKKQRIPHKFLPWIDARKKFRLSNAHIQMARELGLSPKRFGSYADRTNQPWKLPLPEFIEAQYQKQFGKQRPDEVLSMEEIAAAHVAKRAARKAERAKSAQQEETDSASTENTSTEIEPADGDQTAADSVLTELNDPDQSKN